jgi:hypothetical protein
LARIKSGLISFLDVLSAVSPFSRGTTRNITLYYIHFEINGVSCNLNGSQECDFSTNHTPSSAIHAEFAPSFNQSHLSADFNQSYLIIGFKQPINFKKNVICK